jgi:hypothetical protein
MVRSKGRGTLCRQSIAVWIANDRWNLFNSAKHSEEANDSYEYSDQSLSHCVTLGTWAHQHTHALMHNYDQSHLMCDQAHSGRRVMWPTYRSFLPLSPSLFPFAPWTYLHAPYFTQPHLVPSHSQAITNFPILLFLTTAICLYRLYTTKNKIFSNDCFLTC